MCEYHRVEENQRPMLDRETYERLKGGEKDAERKTD